MTSDQSSIINHQSSILLCPGQGAQHVGMGKAWAQRSAVAAQTFEFADQLLGFTLSKLCFEGPADDLHRTDNAQAALYVTSVACYRALHDQKVVTQIGATAGLSLGEFTALHLADAIDFETGLRLVRLRGVAMQEAAQASDSTMIALVGASADEAQAQAICEEALRDPENKGDEVLVPANLNCPGQVVLSGSRFACDRAVIISEKLGLRATELSVAGAFHSPLMQPAADRLAEALDAADFQPPRVTVMSNVTGDVHGEDVSEIKRLLVEQLTSPVRWEQDMRALVASHPQGRYIELAPGKVLSGLMRRIERSVKVENHADPA